MKNSKYYLSLILSFIALSASAEADENSKFLTFLEDEWQYELRQSPVYATAMGVKGYETLWRDNSLEAIEARRSHNKDTVEALKGFEKENLSKANQLNLRLFTDLAKKEVEIDQFNRHLLPFNHRGGIQLAHEDAENLPFKNSQDYRFWIERLKNLDKRINQTILLAKLGIKKGCLL